MPFGAECRPDGSVRFHFWAPAAHQVAVCLDEDGKIKRLPLQPCDQRSCGQGWFEIVTDAAKPGTLYRYQIDGGQQVPDPASRFQPRDVHGPSAVVDPRAFEWQDDAWLGRRWEEAVIYEIHVGAFTPAGTFASVSERLDYLSDVGVTAIELMPVADFPGNRNWGYDGVYPFAPDSTYGRPEELKQLVQAAHARGMMVFLDVVYNHFGPEGNYLGLYAPQFFTDRHHTPWGNAINFDGAASRAVRDFFIHNALYWLTEYHFDGLRLDAVNAILDDSTPDILTELAQAVRSAIEPLRQVHLVLENDRNQSHYLRRTESCRPRAYNAQWNDDIHHALHVIMTGEKDGYYSDYVDRPLDRLGRCLVEGFAYQGEASLYRNGEKRGEPTRGLPPTAFVSFLQNHDQIGNRAFGERILTLADARAVRAATAILLLNPSPPLLFMGEEFGAQTPFLFFCNFEKDLAAAVTAGRRNEFALFAKFSDPASREGIADPNAVRTFEISRLDWNTVAEPLHQEWLVLYRKLLALRCRYIVPHLSPACGIKANYEARGSKLTAEWNFSDAKLTLLANLGTDSISAVTVPDSTIIYASEDVASEDVQGNELPPPGALPPWSVVWSLQS
jgi:maltooligosyltrehalose trehalohydrolase